MRIIDIQSSPTDKNTHNKKNNCEGAPPQFQKHVAGTPAASLKAGTSGQNLFLRLLARAEMLRSARVGGGVVPAVMP